MKDLTRVVVQYCDSVAPRSPSPPSDSTWLPQRALSSTKRTMSTTHHSSNPPPPHSHSESLTARLEAMVLASPSTSSSTSPASSAPSSEELDSGYSSENEEGCAALGPRSRRRSKLDESAWVRRWLGEIAQGSATSKAAGGSQEEKRVRKLAAEAATLVEYLAVDTGSSSFPHIGGFPGLTEHTDS